MYICIYTHTSIHLHVSVCINHAGQVSNSLYVINESCHTHEWFICDPRSAKEALQQCHMWMRHVTQARLSCSSVLVCVAWLIHVWHDSFLRICPVLPSLCRSRMCEMTQSCVTSRVHMWQHAFICDMTHSPVIWLIHLWHDAFMCDLTHSCVTWLIHLWHDSFMCDMTHSCTRPALQCLSVSFIVCRWWVKRWSGVWGSSLGGCGVVVWTSWLVGWSKWHCVCVWVCACACVRVWVCVFVYVCRMMAATFRSWNSMRKVVLSRSSYRCFSLSISRSLLLSFCL